MKTDTPETDAKASPHIGFYSCATVPADFARKLERERDEAREHLSQISEYGTEEINAAVELRQKLAAALVERDEAREERDIARLQRDEAVADHQRAFKELEESKNEIDQYFKERDEAREALDEETKFHHRTHRELVLTQCKLMDVTHNIIATLEQNRHLADGDDCTLFKLKSVVPEWK